MITNTELSGSEFISKITDKELIVYEDIQGSKIWVNYNGENWMIYPKTLSSKPIDLIELTLQNYYNNVYYYLNTLPTSVTDLVSTKWYFCFEYFTDYQPAHISYDKTPKNNLILTCIYKGNKTYNIDINELKTYSELFDVDMLPIIYKGILSTKQLQLCNYYLQTSEKDIPYIFSETNFAEFFYKLLNPNLKNSFLMDNEFQSNIEKIIIKVENEELSLAILNPMYKKMEIDNNTDFLNVYSIILSNFIQYCNTLIFDIIYITGTDYNECYVDYICTLYNLYMEEISKDIYNFNFIIPPFFKQDKFKINTKLINNKDTLSWIEKSPKFEYVLKILLSGLQKEKNKTFGIFTEGNLIEYNNLIKKIKNNIYKKLNFAQDVDTYNNKILTFDEYFNTNKEEDLTGQVYPSINIDSLSSKKDKLKKK